MLWDLSTTKRIATFCGHKKSIWSLDFSANSTLLVSASADETVCIWDITSSGGKPSVSPEGEERFDVMLVDCINVVF
jgi:transcription initiation factor TFIID subunit 5